MKQLLIKTTFVLFISFATHAISYGQADTIRLSDSSFARCGLSPKWIMDIHNNNPVLVGSGSLTDPTDPLWNPLAIDYCGAFAVYYDDVQMGTGCGFDDQTIIGGNKLGKIRRTTYCLVLTYIQSIFSFVKIISPDYVTIHVIQSWT